MSSHLDGIHHIRWYPSGRGKSQCPPNPEYPAGIDLRAPMAPGAPHCTIKLPYPAPECGQWLVECAACELSVLITAAGRPDDPKSVTVACQYDDGRIQ